MESLAVTKEMVFDQKIMGSQAPCARDKIITFHSRHIQEVCGSSRKLTALVLKFAGAQLFYSYLTLNTSVV